jgi:polysaccharide biosynthesis protein PelA
MIFRVFLAAAVCMACFVSAPAAAQTHARQVLVLWDSSVTPRWRDTLAHTMLEMPLNRLGYIAQPVDLAAKLPDPGAFVDARAVVVWLQSDSVPDPADATGFLRAAVARGLGFVLIGEPAFLRARKGGGEIPNADANALFASVGFMRGAAPPRLAIDVDLERREPALLDYERRLDLPVAPFAVWRPTDARMVSSLVLRRRGQPDSESHVVMSGPTGGLIASGFSHFLEPDLNRRQWRIDPFAFLARALAHGDAPVPDTTTLVGRRLYFSHIDGDGWRNVTQIPPWNRQRKLASAVVLDEIIAPYPDLPVTVAPIAADLHPDWCGTDDGRAIARRAFALPQVEAASHTWTHPFDWPFFERPDAQAIERAIATRYPGCHEKPPWYAAVVARVVRRFSGTSDERRLEIEFDGQYAEAGAYNTPRAYALKPYSLDVEIGAAAAYLETFAPMGKKIRIVQWSGNTLPSAEALAAAEQAGLHHINGGDTRFDRDFNSVSYVAPIGRRVGAHWQIYAPSSNENTYTDLWTDRFFAFRDWVETVARTGAPQRLTPINLYYHIYSGEKEAALQALRDNVAFVRKLEIVPVAASRYTEIASGFYTARITKIAERTWRVENRGALATLRFDAPNDRARVDLARSSGVLGYRRDAGALYVALDPAHETPVVALGESEPSQPMLVHSRWPIAELRRSASGFSFAAEGFGAGEMLWRVSPGLDYALSLDGQPFATVRANAAGELSFALPAATGRRVSVALAEVRP